MDDQNVSEGTQSRGHYFALSAGSKLNEFEIVSVLGHGGFGITYLAKDTLLDEQVALKEFFPNELAVRITDQTVRAKSDDEDSDFQSGLNAFLGEARLLARFRKLNIVHVRRFFEMHGTGYIVQDYEQGETLSKRLDKGPVEEAELRHLLEGVLNGLETVHERGILHRDLKPDNIIIRADGTPVLIDFGAARDFTVRQSRTVTAIASGSYTPPEQWGAGEQPGPWSDLYSLGAVAYRCVTGNPPPMALKRLGKDPMVPAVTAGQGRYDAALLRCIDWMLEVDESKRPLSVQMVQQALDGKGPASVPGARSSTKLKRVGALVAGLALAGALIGGGYVLYGQWQLRSLNQQLTAKLTAAGYDKTALTSFLSQCGSTCPEDLHKEAQAKLDTVATEAQQYQSAGDDPAKLRSYASTCKACLAKTEALKRASDIEAKAATVAAMTKKLAKAGYDKTALTSFLSQCGDTCPDDLRKEAQAKLDTVATEAQQYQSAGDDPAKLRSYASTCKACLAKTEALDRVTAIEEQAAHKAAMASKLQDAGYDKTALTSFLSQCGDTCPDDLRKEAQAKLDTVATEAQQYQSAGDDLNKLVQYMQTCQACEFKAEALPRVEALRASEDYARLAVQLNEAHFNAAALNRFVAECGTTCPGNLRQSALVELDLLATEERQYRAASGDAGKLRGYANTCEACLFKTEALHSAGELEQATSAPNAGAPTNLEATPPDTNSHDDMQFDDFMLPPLSQSETELPPSETNTDSSNSSDATPVTSPITSPTFRFWINRDLDGGDLKQLSSVTLQKCISVCRRRLDCKGFSYDKWNRLCNLKAAVGRMRIEPRCLSGTRKELPRPIDATTPINAAEHLYNRRLIGTSYKKYTTPDFSDCQQYCTEEPNDCIGYSFHSQTNTCELFGQIDDTQSDSKSQSGIRRQVPSH